MDPILYLVHRLPFPPDKGDRIRAFHILKFLASLGPVHLATLADEPVSFEARAGLAKLEALCEKLTVVPLPRSRPFRILWSLARGRSASEGAFDSPVLRQVLENWCREKHFRACIVSASSMAPYLRLPCLRDVPAVVDLVDVDSEKWLDYAAAGRPPKSWLYRLEARRLRQLESELPASTRAVTLISNAEVDIFHQFARSGRIQVISNGVDLDYFQPRNEAESGCVFVGALDYWPNVDGICWFCQEIWPKIQQRHTRARLSIVGRRPVTAVRRLKKYPGVEVIGQVPDVRPYYARAAVVVAPLRIARGVPNKILEALAMGKAVVASSNSLRGLKALPKSHLLRADSSLEWQKTILRLFEDQPLRRQLGNSGRQFVEEHHCWDRCLEPFGRLLDEVTSSLSHEASK